MSSISVGEARKKTEAASSVRDGAEKRKRRQRDAAKILDDRKREPVPRNTVVARVGVTLSRVSPDVLTVCGNCEHENWKWFDRCARCGRALDG